LNSNPSVTLGQIQDKSSNSTTLSFQNRVIEFEHSPHFKMYELQMHIFYFYLPKSYSSECYNYVFLGESLISSFGKRDNPQSLAQGQKLITTLSRVLLNVDGFDNFLVSFTSIYPTLLWCTATTYQLSISLRTLSSLSLLYKTY
jgi:hypothetical protein